MRWLRRGDDDGKPDRLLIYESMIGEEPARLRVNLVRLQSLLVSGMLIVLIVMMCAALTHNLGLQVAFFVLLVPVFASLIVRLWMRHRYLREVSASMGVKVGRWDDVPLTPGRYEAWCETHCVTPYSLVPAGTTG
jgi:hypothetical protein